LSWRTPTWVRLSRVRTKRARLPASDSKALSQLDWRIPSIVVADANVGEVVGEVVPHGPVPHGDSRRARGSTNRSSPSLVLRRDGVGSGGGWSGATRPGWRRDRRSGVASWPIDRCERRTHWRLRDFSCLEGGVAADLARPSAGVGSRNHESIRRCSSRTTRPRSDLFRPLDPERQTERRVRCRRVEPSS
jgi:hypothetical protein